MFDLLIFDLAWLLEAKQAVVQGVQDWHVGNRPR